MVITDPYWRQKGPLRSSSARVLNFFVRKPFWESDEACGPQSQAGERSSALISKCAPKNRTAAAKNHALNHFLKITDPLRKDPVQ